MCWRSQKGGFGRSFTEALGHKRKMKIAVPKADMAEAPPKDVAPPFLRALPAYQLLPRQIARDQPPTGAGFTGGREIRYHSFA